MSKEEMLENWFRVSEYDFSNAEVDRLTLAMQQYADQQTACLSADLETAKRGLATLADCFDKGVYDTVDLAFVEQTVRETLKQLSQ